MPCCRISYIIFPFHWFITTESFIQRIHQNGFSVPTIFAVTASHSLIAKSAITRIALHFFPNSFPTMISNHNKFIKMAKGFRGRSKNCFKLAKARVEKALQYAYRSRRLIKRDFRSLWISRINAAVREHGITYNQFIFGLNRANILLDRKMLADICVTEPFSFKAVVDTVRKYTPMVQVIRRVDQNVLESHVQAVVQDSTANKVVASDFTLQSVQVRSKVHLKKPKFVPLDRKEKNIPKL